VRFKKFLSHPCRQSRNFQQITGEDDKNFGDIIAIDRTEVVNPLADDKAEPVIQRIILMIKPKPGIHVLIILFDVHTQLAVHRIRL
jgi:hypothetical protein